MKLKRINHPRRSNEAPALWGYSFMCPGCDDAHAIPTTGPNAWQFNGDIERPTLSPSILVYESQYPESRRVAGVNYQKRCHSFVREGRIEFLSDCGHALAGQTVELPDLEGCA